ncbi:cyclic GMP-AMP synthase-like receptor [Parasteatoda tepidariorum]|uniref:cyclic GMP-AMP synthase-like receptor n=1 Tax=Parasteatoda tepidariorum TaxID=114398 RepID=UPI0039BD2E99
MFEIAFSLFSDVTLLFLIFDLYFMYEIEENQFNIWPEVTELDEIPSFAKYNVTDSSNLSSENSELKTFFDSENYLHASYLMKWFQSLIDSFIFHFHSTYPGLSEIRTTHSGPARTIKLLFNSEWISVDLVPVISIAAKKLLKCTFCNVANFQEESLAYCFLVPKPVKSDLSSLLSNEVLERVWRVHLPEMEKNIIQKKNTLKKLIKLMKYLRDQENWPICSYFIKVMAYWLVKEHPDAKWWKDSKLGLLFVEFLKAMQGHLDKKFLRHILYPAFNLFHSLNDRTMFNMKQRIQTIISQIEMNPKYILRIYNVPILIHRSL